MSSKNLLLFIVVGAIALVLGFIAGQNPEPAKAIELQGGTSLAHHQRQLPPVNLQDHNGQAISNESLKGKWHVVFFGYTLCPDICPVALSTLQESLEILEKHQLDKAIQVVFVSVDPERDTLENLKAYTTYFHPQFLGATGDDAALQALTRPLGILYNKVQDNGESGYLVDHSGSILVFTPDATLGAVFGAPHDAKIIANDLQTLIANYKS